MVWNYREVLDVVEGIAEGMSGTSVVAVLTGHDHTGGYHHDEATGIHHVSFAGQV